MHSDAIESFRTNVRARMQLKYCLDLHRMVYCTFYRACVLRGASSAIPAGQPTNWRDPFNAGCSVVLARMDHTLLMFLHLIILTINSSIVIVITAVLATIIVIVQVNYVVANKFFPISKEQMLKTRYVHWLFQVPILDSRFHLWLRWAFTYSGLRSLLVDF